MFPGGLNIAQIIPLYKKDDPHITMDQFSFYRCFPSYAFEKAVFLWLHDYLNLNNFLYRGQCRFHNLQSREPTFLVLPIGVFLDLSKAFATLKDMASVELN